MRENIFKAYDVRGKYPKELNESVVFEIGSKLAKLFKKRAKIVVGRDIRLSSPSLYKAVIKGIKNQESSACAGRGIGGKNKKSIIRDSKFIIHAVGIVSTPMFYFLVNKLKADGGIMITASHNPKEYNGLKVVRDSAKPISGTEIKKIVLG